MSESNHRQVYAKGVYDALAALGIDLPEGTTIGEFLKMNAKQARSAVSNLTTICRKVYETVPVGDKLTSKEIQRVLHRTSGVNIDIKTISGCLNNLVEQNLISEPTARRFTRKAIYEKPVVVKPAKKESVRPVTVNTKKPVEVEAPKEESNIVVELFTCVTKLSDQANAMIKTVADLEAMVVSLEDEMGEDNEEISRLRELGALLNKIKG